MMEVIDALDIHWSSGAQKLRLTFEKMAESLIELLIICGGMFPPLDGESMGLPLLFLFPRFVVLPPSKEPLSQKWKKKLL